MFSHLILAIGFSSLAQSGQTQQIATRPDSTTIRDTTRFEQVWIMGLQGNVAGGLVFLDSLADSTLTPRQHKLRQNYYSRFRNGDESFSYLTNDTAVIRVMDLYHRYWRQGLLDGSHLEQYDSLLADSVSTFLVSHDPALQGESYSEIRDSFTECLSDFLKRNGVYSAVGKTGQFYDLLLHVRETEHSYPVTTPEDTLQVKVVFMDSVISNGWEEFATFGKYYPGGWATDDALYCVHDAYDTSSENFTISYLKHEGKHFADYKRFPKLTGADLEYRAKLVELSCAQKSTYELIQIFLDNSSTDRQNPHAFANHCVIRDLSEACGLTMDATRAATWVSVPIETIQRHARELLLHDTEELVRLGADTVQEYIQ